MLGHKTSILFLFLLFDVIYSGCPYHKQNVDLPKISQEPRFFSAEVADPETSTPNGCTCNSLCGATIEDGFTKDWCTVEGSCGEYSLTWGYWDYCLYKDSSKPDYLALNWETKHDQLWSEIKSDSSLGEYYPTQMFTESLITTFENEWDVLPEGRNKAIHGNGAICPFTVDVSNDSPFTGLLKAGGKITGFIRMGPAADFTSSLTPGLSPGVSIKFLRTEASSANFVMIKSLPPLPDNNHNFFSTDLATHIPDDADSTALAALAARFCSAGHCITKVGLSNLCTHDQDGTEFDDPIFPFKITFEPTGEINFPEAKPETREEFINQFKAIAPGTRLYKIKAKPNPEETGFVLGEVVTADECVSSLFGDTKMFFKHQWIEEDIALRPEWADAYYDECYCNAP